MFILILLRPVQWSLSVFRLQEEAGPVQLWLLWKWNQCFLSLIFLLCPAFGSFVPDVTLSNFVERQVW